MKLKEIIYLLEKENPNKMKFDQRLSNFFCKMKGYPSQKISDED
tara:strand:+ start:2485 stop:2616 length:132 start_codon:yes stop_codon:yes gene_type:complete